MSPGTRLVRSRWTSPRPARAVAAVIVTAVLVLLVAACGGGSISGGSGGSSSARGSSSFPSAVAYSACMRSHGVPNFPDPGSDGQVPKADAPQLGISTSQLQAAQQACQSVYPTNGGSNNGGSRFGPFDAAIRRCEESGDCPPALVQQAMTQLRTFAQCMRSHGLPKFPDPIRDSDGRPAIFIRPWIVGFDPDSNQFANTEKGCQGVMHPFFTPPLAIYLPGNGEGG
jgi:hypothetical protein